MTSEDVIIVGGGPGGSTAAWQLARAGLKPLVLEACQFPRVKLCAGWLPPPVWRDLEIAPQDYPLTLQEFSKVRLTASGRTWEESWPRTVGYGIIRSEFDNFLLERAIDSGARVRFQCRVEGVESITDGVRITTAEETFEARIAVGAGGTHCPISRHFAPKNAESLVAAQEAESHLDEQLLRSWTPCYGIPELAFESDFLGYSWYFTKGDYLNIGTGALRGGASLRDRLEGYRQQLLSMGRIPADEPLERFRGHSYHVFSHHAPLGGDHFVLLGDAAGLARPISGDGIAPAIHSGRIAAEVIANFFANGTPLTAYEATIRRGQDSLSQKLLNRLGGLFPTRWLPVIAKLVCRIGPLRKRILLEQCFGFRMQVPS